MAGVACYYIFLEIDYPICMRYNLPMRKSGFVKKLVGVVLLVATLLGGLHHHNDLKTHHDCPICTLQNNLASGNVAESFTLAPVENIFLPPLPSLDEIKLSNRPETVSARSPPLFS